jgi:hypothetical protein
MRPVNIREKLSSMFTTMFHWTADISTRMLVSNRTKGV